MTFRAEGSGKEVPLTEKSAVLLVFTFDSPLAAMRIRVLQQAGAVYSYTHRAVFRCNG